MFTILMLAAAATSGPSQTSDSWPPLPDFKRQVDYLLWYERRLGRGGCDPAQNAYRLYRKIFGLQGRPAASQPAGTSFSGFRHPKKQSERVQVGPWDPRKHPDWEASYQRTKATLATFQEAAAMPYCLFPTLLSPDSGPQGDFPTLVGILLPHLHGFRQCALGLSEAAWRAEGGRVDPAGFLDSCRARLQAAGQLDREGILISHLVSLVIRETAYEDLRYALKWNVFDRAGRTRVTTMLERSDRPIEPLASCLRLECAMMLDLLQYVTRLNWLGKPRIDRTRYERVARTIGPRLSGGQRVPSAEIRRVDPVATARQVRGFYVDLAALTNKGYPHVTRRDVEAFIAARADTNAFLRRFMSSDGRAYETQTKLEAHRRATRLLYELHVFHDAHGRWPRSLNELPADVVRRFGIDPFRAKPFVYKLTEQGPLLYSAWVNGSDDGGKPTPEPARDGQVPEGDFIFWPIPTEGR